jgi:MFS family permease
MIIGSRPQSVHYGWVIIAVGGFVTFSCIGLARFAYTMILPGMQAGLGLSYDSMGLVSTANFIGYLVAVILSPVLIRFFRPRPTIASALLLICLCMFGISTCKSFWPVVALYGLTGIGTGFANIPMMVMVTYWFRSKQRGKAAGLIICGNSLGIMFAGYLIPLLSDRYGPEGWRMAWLVLAAISLLISVGAAFLLRSEPADLGLEPMGQPGPLPSVEGLKPRNRPDVGSILVRLGVLYLVFGITFMVYGTFIVTTMIKEYGLSDQQAGFYWSWVGFFSLFSGVGFGVLSDRVGRSRGLALVFAVQTAAYLLAGLKLGNVGLMISIVLYGLSVLAIPTIMAAAVGEYMGLSRAASAFAAITIFFALGQAVGPGAAGFIAATTGSFTTAYKAASLLTAGAAVLAVTLPAPAGPD